MNSSPARYGSLCYLLTALIPAPKLLTSPLT